MPDSRQAPAVTIRGAQTPEETATAMLAGLTIPDRISAVPGDPWWHPVWSSRVRDVRLDGQPVDDVCAFDRREGWVEVLLRDPRSPANDPRPLMVAGVTVRERRRGRVDATFGIPA